MRLGTMTRVLVATLALSMPAGATDHQGMFVVGGGVGALGSRLWIDGRRTKPYPGMAAGLEYGYLRVLRNRSLALGGLIRSGTFPDRWSSTVAEGRYRIDLRLVSEASWVIALGRIEEPRLTASAAFGPTVAWVVPPARDLVIERYDTGFGLHGALRLGMRLRLLGRHQGYYAVEGALHGVSVKRTAFVRGASPQAQAERYRFQDHSLGVVAGYALSL